MSKLLSWLKIFFISSEALGNINAFDNSEGLDNVVKLEPTNLKRPVQLRGHLFVPDSATRPKVVNATTSITRIRDLGKKDYRRYSVH